MRYKREHEYKLEGYEERIYKEVLYDMRPDKFPDEETILLNPLKKASVPHRIRNLDETAS